MDSHAFFNVRVWNLRAQGLTIKEIADESNLDPESVLQRLGFDGLNEYSVTESELEEAGLDLSVAEKYGLEVNEL